VWVWLVTERIQLFFLFFIFMNNNFIERKREKPQIPLKRIQSKILSRSKRFEAEN